MNKLGKIFCFLISLCFFAFSGCSNFLDENVKASINHELSIPEYDLPVAKIEEPAFFEEGVPKNKAIIISFSKPVDPQTFEESFTIKDELSNNLKAYFLEPIWSNGNKLVTIPVNENNLIDLTKKGKMDIWVTLSKQCTTLDKIPIRTAINHVYIINDNTDNFPPLLKAVKAELPYYYLNEKEENETINLIEGEITLENREEIFETNHIKSKLDFYIEGSDFGGGNVYGHLQYQRLYDSAGNETYDPPYSFISPLENINFDGNNFGSFCLDLSGPEYLDGLYKIKVTVQDAFNWESDKENPENCRIYYVIRDTIMAYSGNALMAFKAPPENCTALDIEKSRYQINLNYLTDDVYYVFNDTEYKSTIDDYLYYFSWGTQAEDLSVPVQLYGYYEENEFGEALTDEGKIYQLPQDFMIFCKDNEDEDIILKVSIADAVGNTSEINTVIPKKIDFYNYTVSDFGEDKKQIQLNYSNMTTDLSRFSKVPGKLINARYYVFWGIKQYWQDDSDIILKRNIDYKNDPEGKRTDLSLIRGTGSIVPFVEPEPIAFENPETFETPEDFENPEALENSETFETPDNFEITEEEFVYSGLEKDSEYIVYIQPVYVTSSATGGSWTGNTLGPLYRVEISTAEREYGDEPKGLPSVPMFDPDYGITKESEGPNTGRFKISIHISNPQINVKYVPCFYDGKDWSFYPAQTSRDLEFSVANPIKAPLGAGEKWAVEGTWRQSNYFEAVKNSRAAYGDYSVYTKVKLLAVNDAGVTESIEKVLIFEESDDNIPPQQLADISNHDSILSYDGHSFLYEQLIKEDEGHLSPVIKYTYIPYDESWGDKLDVAMPEELEAISWWGITNYEDSWTFVDSSSGGAGYNLKFRIPVNGLADGKYMFFARVADTFDNYNYITLGKAHIGTFKNKLKVELASDKKHFISTLPIEQNEKFGRNMINVQSMAPWKEKENEKWTDWFGEYNQLQNCIVRVIDGKTCLVNENRDVADGTFVKVRTLNNDGKTLVYNDEGLPILDKIKPKPLEEGLFYRLTVQGFNENPLDPATMKGVDTMYGRPYNEQIYKTSIAQDSYVPGESEYDLCTEETVSNTVYYYIPFESDKNFAKEIKTSFFKNTASPRSNKPYIVNLISSPRDLGNDIDEWERRGKLIKTHYYDPNASGQEHPEFKKSFNDSLANEYMAASGEKGFVYYVAVVHFADNTRAISNVYTIQGY